MSALATCSRRQIISRPTGFNHGGSNLRIPVPCRTVQACAAKRSMILMRHADSLDQPNVRDHDRAISSLGTETAQKVALILQSMGWLPDLLLCSNSKRTRQTVDAMAEAVSIFGDVDAHYLGTLYTVAALDGQTQSHLSMRVKQFAHDAENTRLMCVGHNRGWEEAASAFCGRKVSLESANAALLQVEADSWEEALEADVVWTLLGVVTSEGFIV